MGEQDVHRSRKQYASLETCVKTLSEKTIRRRWVKTSIPTQSKITDLLRTIERSALSYAGQEKKRIDAQAMISDLVDQLIERIPRMPFPPGTNLLTFDFEATINSQREMENELTANTHTIGLLNSDISAETELLNKERAELELLENDTKEKEVSEQRRARLHPILRDSSDQPPPRLPLEYESRSDGRASVASISDLRNDLAVKPVIDEIQCHLDSMDRNSEGPDKISTALSLSQAAIDVFNWRKLRDPQYRQVYSLNAA